MTDNKKVENELKEKLVAINRITKVVKGGRRFGFAALVVVGNLKGSVGIGQGKSKQVPDAIKKATEVAKRNLTKIPLKEGRTLHHDVKGKNGSGKVFLRVAGGPSSSGRDRRSFPRGWRRGFRGDRRWRKRESAIRRPCAGGSAARGRRSAACTIRSSAW